MEGRFLGSLYGHGTGYAGAVWDAKNVSPTLNTMQGGGTATSYRGSYQIGGSYDYI